MLSSRWRPTRLCIIGTLGALLGGWLLAASVLGLPVPWQSATGNGQSGTGQIALASMFRDMEAADGQSDIRQITRCFDDAKRAYAKRHGYHYFTAADYPSEDASMPYYAFMRGKTGRYSKLIFLLHLMRTHREVSWFMWLDADATITNASIRIEERLQVFAARRTTAATAVSAAGPDSSTESPTAVPQTTVPRAPSVEVVLAIDRTSLNTGVFLVHNSLIAEHVLHATFKQAVDPSDNWADQRSLISFLKESADEEISRHVLVLPKGDFGLLQAYPSSLVAENPKATDEDRVRMSWRPGSWVLHLPGKMWWRRRQMVRELGLCSE